MSQEMDRLAAFEEYRVLLFSIAYRMLGSVSDAEDMLQDAFVRWQRASNHDIESPKAFLITIVSRLCINYLESARVRREEYVGEWLPEPLVTEATRESPDAVEAGEAVSMALLLLLERLSPSERAVFLLQEIFGYKHAEIAAALGLSEANCRQLLRRARHHVQKARPRFKSSPDEHLALLLRFRQAAESGDMEQLLTMLSDDVVFHSDGGGKAPSLPKPLYGRTNVAKVIVHGSRRFGPQDYTRKIVSIHGQPAVVSYRDGKPQAVFTIEARDGRVEAIYIISNPEKLRHLPPPE
jgi:RNA polymerase sigma-70 factor (ECF subfamily)